MTGLEVSAVIAFSIAGILLLLFGVALFLAGRELTHGFGEGLEDSRPLVDVPIHVSSRPRIHDWDLEGDFERDGDPFVRPGR